MKSKMEKILDSESLDNVVGAGGAEKILVKDVERIANHGVILRKGK